MLRVSDPDTLIAERLSGQAPFMAHDPFFDGPDPSAPVAQAPAETSSQEGQEEEEGDVSLSEAGSADGIEARAADGAAGDETFAPEESLADHEPEPARSGRQPPASGGGEIDLTGALGDLDAKPSKTDGGAAAGKLDQAFARIRTDAETDADFSTQHMTLARTYLEIGMVDEAIASLQTAVRSPRQRFEAAAALGRVHQQRGEEALAIEWLERAAEVPAPTADEGRQLLYDLGALLDAAGETSRALAVFLELQADAGDYRDVPARIDRLARVQTGG
jgi:hypothetical protein